MKRLIAFSLVALIPSLTAQDPMIKKIAEEGQQRSQVMDHLNHLTNRIGPRLTSSDRLTQAADWAVEQFRSWGLAARKAPKHRSQASARTADAATGSSLIGVGADKRQLGSASQKNGSEWRSGCGDESGMVCAAPRGR